MLPVAGGTSWCSPFPSDIALTVRVGKACAITAPLVRAAVLSRMPVLLALKALGDVAGAVEQLTLHKFRAP